MGRFCSVAERPGRNSDPDPASILWDVYAVLRSRTVIDRLRLQALAKEIVPVIGFSINLSNIARERK